MSTHISGAGLNSTNEVIPGPESGPCGGFGYGKIEGYNAGIQAAAERFELLIFVIFTAQFLNVFFVRWIRKEDPLELRVLPFDIPEDYIWKFSNAANTTTLVLVTYLIASVFLGGPLQVQGGV